MHLRCRTALVPSLWVALIALTSCALESVAREKHASFHGCPEDAVTSTEVDVGGQKYVKTEGCGTTEMFRCIVAKCRSPRLLVVRQFSHDESCPEGQITTTEAGTNLSASGCGKQATYTCTDDKEDVISCERRP